MKLLTGVNVEETRVFYMEQDGNDINIMCNGELIVYFRVSGDKIMLETVNISDSVLIPSFHMNGSHIEVNQ
jgi:hypothetical protein